MWLTQKFGVHQKAKIIFSILEVCLGELDILNYARIIVTSWVPLSPMFS